MKKNRSLAVVTEDNLITKIIKSLKNFLRFKQRIGPATNACKAI